MINVERRDYFAANADTSWIDRGSRVPANLDNASALTGVPVPSDPISDADLYLFWVRVEIAWRWKFADLMAEGKDTGRG